MKWPESLTLIRHDESEYNALKKKLKQNSKYQKFRAEFEKDPLSEKAVKLAEELKDEVSIKSGDWNTPLAEDAGHQTEKMATKLKELIKLPDVIFVSPYKRTHHTLEFLKRGWPELKSIKTVEEERIREQEHGLVTIYNDWRIFQTLHPEQRELYNLEGEYYYRFPQGENVEDVRERTRSWFNTLTRDFPEKNVLAVTHHLTILAVRANLERLNAKDFLYLDEHEKPINAGVTIYRGNPELGKDGKLILESYNMKLY